MGGGSLVKKWTDCTESFKNSNEQVERLWVKIGGQDNKGNLTFGVCFRSLSKRGLTD